MIPIIIICYNNYKYVDNTLKQILKINKDYYKNIQILNNCSTCIDTVNFLKNIDVKVIDNYRNEGPWITINNNSHIYNIMPEKFILTDPDLELNEYIPNNFIEILSMLSDKYNCNKIGVALDIKDFYKMYQSNNYCNGMNIYNWEKQFWVNKINDSEYELYNAPIDTTFCLINKKYLKGNIRIAQNFTSKHLPWYIDNKIYKNIYELYRICENQTNISTTSKIIISYIENNYIKMYKNNELFLIDKNKYNLKIKYGILNNNIDVTNVALKKCVNNNILSIPSNDHERARIFEIDPLYGVLKSVFIYDEKDNLIDEYYYDEDIIIDIEIDIQKNIFFSKNIQKIKI